MKSLVEKSLVVVMLLAVLTVPIGLSKYLITQLCALGGELMHATTIIRNPLSRHGR